MKTFSISHLILMLIFLLTPQSGLSQGTYLWNSARLREIKSNPTKYRYIHAQSRSIVEHYLSDPLIIITDKPNTFVSDTHNYASLSPYFWPDPSNPRGKYILKDGQRNPEYLEYDGKKLTDLEARLRLLSMAYYFSEDTKYRNAYLKQLRAFFIDRDTYMYPNFDYAQIAPGHDNNNGRAWGIIEAYNFNSIIESIRLVNSVSPIDSKTIKSLRKWFKRFASWLDSSDKGVTVYNSDSNQGIAYDVLLLNLHLFTTGKISYSDYKNFRSHRLLVQFDSEGKQPEEIKRTKPMDYSIYNLSHVVDMCLILQSARINYYSENKDIIDRAFNYLLQFAGHKERFPYKDISPSWEELERKLYFQYNRLSQLRKKPSPYNVNYFAGVSVIYF